MTTKEMQARIEVLEFQTDRLIAIVEKALGRRVWNTYTTREEEVKRLVDASSNSPVNVLSQSPATDITNEPAITQPKPETMQHPVIGNDLTTRTSLDSIEALDNEEKAKSDA